MDRFHARFDRTAHRRFGDSEVLENRGLPFDGCAAVTSHGGHDEGLGSPAFDRFDDALDRLIDAVDAPTASRDRYPHPGLDGVSDLGTGYLLDHRRCRIAQFGG